MAEIVVQYVLAAIAIPHHAARARRRRDSCSRWLDESAAASRASQSARSRGDRKQYHDNMQHSFGGLGGFEEEVFPLSIHSLVKYDSRHTIGQGRQPRQAARLLLF